MRIWHDTPDAPRTPSRAEPGAPITIVVGTAPIEPGQRVWVDVQIEQRPAARADATWLHNVAGSSYWNVGIGPFARGERVTYVVHGRGTDGVEVSTAPRSFRVGAKLHVAILWHQHQPCYVDPRIDGPARVAKPWVRLHALRDYYGMAALAAEFPDVHVTINLTPVLVDQIEQYTLHDALDAALALTATPAEALSTAQQRELLGTFFDADWHHQIFAHPRYRDLFEQRTRREHFSAQDLTDVQMWFNLAWFGRELRDGEVALATGEVASVRRFVEQGRGFDRRDIDEMLAEQYKILRAVVPLHRALQDRGQLEISTTPYYHPILPLLIDSDGALLDRPGTSLPGRFARPEDADEQVRRAIDHYIAHFDRRPRGMWPAEGAVSPAAVELFERHGLEWIATDAGVLARSGRWGYRVDLSDVAYRPYRSGEPGLDIFFRDTELSNEVGFRLHQIERADDAAARLVQHIEERVLTRVSDDGDRILTLALDGDNAWGAYADDGRPFLRALYARLAQHPDLETVTFSEYLGGRPPAVAAHTAKDQERVYELATASWADEPGSAPGVDLGTWIGEAEENRAWDLLRSARDALAAAGMTPARAPAAFESLYAAEGSDWFWWFGDDQESGRDEDFDDLFRAHLGGAYRRAGLPSPAALEAHIVPHKVLWTFTRPVASIGAGDVLQVRTSCPGRLDWQVDDEAPRSTDLVAAGGVMAGPRFHLASLGPFAPAARRVRFRFHCHHRGCDGTGPCCRAGEQVVEIRGAAGPLPG